MRYGRDDVAADADRLVPAVRWHRRACCSLAKNGTVFGGATAVELPASRVAVDVATPFSIACYVAQSDAPIVYPVAVTLGERVRCRVTADTWDDAMLLVLAGCHFYPDDVAGGGDGDSDQPVYTFIENRQVLRGGGGGGGGGGEGGGGGGRRRTFYSIIASTRMYLSHTPVL